MSNVWVKAGPEPRWVLDGEWPCVCWERCCTRCSPSRSYTHSQVFVPRAAGFTAWLHSRRAAACVMDSFNQSVKLLEHKTPGISACLQPQWVKKHWPTTPNKTLLAFKHVCSCPLLLSVFLPFFLPFFPSFFLSFCLSSNQTKWQIRYNFSINTLFKNVKYLWGREEKITFCVRKARLARFWGFSEDVISVIFHQCEDYWKRCGRKIVTTHDT